MSVARASVLLAVVALACDKHDGAADAGSSTRTTTASRTSCDRITAMSVCSEYSGDYLSANETVVTATCKKLGGSYAADACPNTSVIGSCAIPTGETRAYYASGGAPYDPSKAKTECESLYKGHFAAQ